MALSKQIKKSTKKISLGFIIFVIIGIFLFYYFSEVAACQGELIKHSALDRLSKAQWPSQRTDLIGIEVDSIFVIETYWSVMTNLKDIPNTEEGKTSFFSILNPEVLAWNLGMCDLSELSIPPYQSFSENMRNIVCSFMGELRNIDSLNIRHFNDFYHYRGTDYNDIYEMFTLCRQIANLPTIEKMRCLNIYIRFAPKIAKALLNFLESL